MSERGGRLRRMDERGEVECVYVCVRVKERECVCVWGVGEWYEDRQRMGRRKIWRGWWGRDIFIKKEIE